MDIAGGAEALARFLGLRAGDMRAWAAGRMRVPARVLIALIDIVSTNRLDPKALQNLIRRPDPAWIGPERRRLA